MTTQSFLASDPHAILHAPRCIAIARSVMDSDPRLNATQRRRMIEILISELERVDHQWISGPSFHDDEAAYDLNVAAVNLAGAALLTAVGAEYT